MNSWKMLAALALLSLLSGGAMALECFSVGGLPEYPPNSPTVMCSSVEDSCYEYEDFAGYYKDVYRLVYHAGCGRCPRKTPYNCSECNENNCNSKVMTDIMGYNRVCFSYFASYDAEGHDRLSPSSVLCPSYMSECFQVHYPAGDSSPGWTFIAGGCGNQKDCERYKSRTKCDVCNGTKCNMPVVPGYAMAADDSAGDRVGAELFTCAWALWLWLLVQQLL